MIKCLPIPVKYSELIKKEVINTCDGCRLGYVCDLEIDAMCGRINALFMTLEFILRVKEELTGF